MYRSQRGKGGRRSRKRRRGGLGSIALRNLVVGGTTTETAAISWTRSPRGRKSQTTCSLNVNVVRVALDQSLAGNGGTSFSWKRRWGTGTMLAIIQCLNLFLAVGQKVDQGVKWQRSGLETGQLLINTEVKLVS
jgi:hypothetical protein